MGIFQGQGVRRFIASAQTISPRQVEPCRSLIFRPARGRFAPPHPVHPWASLHPPIAHTSALTGAHCCSVGYRSRFKKFCKQRQARRGVNAFPGSPYDGLTPSQCLRCDRGQHRPCVRLPTCQAGIRSANGINKRALRRAERRAERRAARGGATDERDAGAPLPAAPLNPSPVCLD